MKEVLLSIIYITMIWIISIALIVVGIVLAIQFKKYKNKRIYDNLEMLEYYIKQNKYRCSTNGVEYYLFYNRKITKTNVNGITKQSVLYDNIHILAEVIEDNEIIDCEFCKINDIFITE